MPKAGLALSRKPRRSDDNRLGAVFQRLSCRAVCTVCSVCFQELRGSTQVGGDGRIVMRSCRRLASMRLTLFVAGFVLITASGCSDGGGPSSDSTTSYFSTVLTANWNGGGYWDVTCRYSLDFDADEYAPDQWVVTGRFLISSYDWAFLGGDSAWVDTLSSFQDVQHSLQLEPRTSEGGWLAVRLSAPADTTAEPSYFRDQRVILLKR